MKTTTKKVPTRLLALTAADVMSVPVMTVPQDITIQEGARMFSESHVTGAPVVDSEGRCLRVLSSSDFVTWAKKGGQAAASEEKVTCFIAPWGEMIDIEDAADDEIRHYMTALPIAQATCGTNTKQTSHSWCLSRESALKRVDRLSLL